MRTWKQILALAAFGLIGDQGWSQEKLLPPIAPQSKPAAPPAAPSGAACPGACPSATITCQPVNSYPTVCHTRMPAAGLCAPVSCNDCCQPLAALSCIQPCGTCAPCQQTTGCCIPAPNCCASLGGPIACSPARSNDVCVLEPVKMHPVAPQSCQNGACTGTASYPNIDVDCGKTCGAIANVPAECGTCAPYSAPTAAPRARSGGLLEALQRLFAKKPKPVASDACKNCEEIIIIQEPSAGTPDATPTSPAQPAPPKAAPKAPKVMPPADPVAIPPRSTSLEQPPARTVVLQPTANPAPPAENVPAQPAAAPTPPPRVTPGGFIPFTAPIPE